MVEILPPRFALPRIPEFLLPGRGVWDGCAPAVQIWLVENLGIMQPEGVGVLCPDIFEFCGLISRNCAHTPGQSILEFRDPGILGSCDLGTLDAGPENLRIR